MAGAFAGSAAVRPHARRISAQFTKVGTVTSPRNDDTPDLPDSPVQNQLTSVDSYTRRMQVEVPWDELQDDYAVFFQKFTKKVRLPGFRKGKVPQKMVRQQFGPAAEAEFAEQAVHESYLAALKETELDPINQATIRGVQFREGAALKFEATFEVEPEVALPNYKKGMKFDQLVFDADSEDVDRAIEELRQQHSELRTVEDGIEEGHFILADLQEVEPSGMPLVGRKLENQYLHLDPAGSLGKENLDVLRGAKPGDSRRVILAGEGGEQTHHNLTVKEVTDRLLPEVDDAFARQVDSRAEDLAQLRANLLQKIEAAYQRESRRRLNRDIAEYFIRAASLEVPASLFENYLESLIEDLERQGYPREQLEREDVREQHRASITWNLKWYLLRKQLIAAEEIDVDDEALEAHIQGLIDADETQANQLRNHFRRPDNKRTLRQELVEEALTERLIGYAKLKLVHRPSSELRKGT